MAPTPLLNYLRRKQANNMEQTNLRDYKKDFLETYSKDPYGFVRLILKQAKVKPLTKKQLSMVILLLTDKLQAFAQIKGYTDGKASVAPQSKEQMRVDISMSIQRLAESNATLAQALSHALDNLKG